MPLDCFRSLINPVLNRLLGPALALICAIIPASATAEVYKLAAGDQLRITLLENEQVNDTYQVEIDGTVSVPGVGIVRAAGLELREFERNLLNVASERFVTPSLSVQIARYRPFFVLGDVDAPGMYSFSPGLNAMRAIAIAGGFGRKVNTDALSRSIAVTQSRKSLSEAQIDLLHARVNLARLQAEREMAETFEYRPTKEDSANPKLDDVIDTAQSLFKTRKDSFMKQLDKLQATLKARTTEVESLEAQLELQDEVLANSKRELAELKDLRDRGLVPENRVSQIIRDEQNVRAQTLQIVTLKRQAEANRVNVERQVTNLVTSRELEIEGNIQAFEATIQRLSARLREERAFLIEAGADVQVLSDAGPNYRLELYRDGKTVSGDIDISAAIEPGDTLFVVLERGVGVGN